MKLKIVYRKNLKMSAGKLAAQSVHAALLLGAWDPKMTVVVLGLSDKKYYETVARHKECARFKDAGMTEVLAGEETCAAFYENVLSPKVEVTEGVNWFPTKDRITVRTPVGNISLKLNKAMTENGIS